MLPLVFVRSRIRRLGILFPVPASSCLSVFVHSLGPPLFWIHKGRHGQSPAFLAWWILSSLKLADKESAWGDKEES